MQRSQGTGCSCLEFSIFLVTAHFLVTNVMPEAFQANAILISGSVGRARVFSDVLLAKYEVEKDVFPQRQLQGLRELQLISDRSQDKATRPQGCHLVTSHVIIRFVNEA